MMLSFGGSDNTLTSFENAKVVILPVPYGKTASFRKGTENGPAAILEASDNLELFDEKLNKEATKRYIVASLKREYASENGTELNSILPKMSPLNPQYLTKKQSVFQKIALFVEKFKGVGGEV